MRRAAGGAVFALAVGLAAAGLAVDGRPPAWDDPVEQWGSIRFSHAFHVADVEAACADCHAAAEESRSASDLLLPGHDECGSCHDVEEAGECSLCHAGEPAGFAAPERDVRFDHHAHVTERGAECARCHSGVERSEAPSTANLPSMESCLECHDDAAAPRACEVCHVHPEALRPLSHTEPGWPEHHGRTVRAGDEASCAACHSDHDCSACHAEAFLQTTRGDRRRVLGELRAQPGGRHGLVLEEVHGLNYVFTHGLDARSGALDCATCHDPVRFCAECHAADQDAGFDSPVPLSHLGADFVRIGVGSGGGRHAGLARREIESCAACHDVEGADPVCITCHVDRTPGRGNDPRTHEAGFADFRGDWHRNPGSVCFHCHTDTRVAGLGFCGYCHGREGD